MSASQYFKDFLDVVAPVDTSKPTPKRQNAIRIEPIRPKTVKQPANNSRLAKLIDTPKQQTPEDYLKLVAPTDPQKVFL